MRPKKNTYVFSVAERVLICLKEHHSGKVFDIPFELTQKGIGSLLRIKVGNIPRYLKRLNKKGYVQILKGRPEGGRRISQFYLVTEKGYRLATSLQERAANAKIILAFPSQDVVTNLYDAISLMPGKPSMTEIITAARNNRIDVTNFVAERARNRGSLYKASPEMPIVESFYGRGNELKKISDWYSSKTEKILAVIGVAGIGKTTLLARAAQEWIRDHYVFWYKLQEYDTPWSIAHAISVFLSSMENRPVSSAISEREMDIGLLSYLLSEEIKGMDIIFVFDDLHKAREEVISTIRAITNIVLRNRRMKIATASRKYVKLVDRRIHMSGAQADLKLNGLEPSAAAHLLPRGLSSENGIAKELIKKTGGHPLLIMNALIGIAGDHGLSKYIEEEVIAGISDTEKEVLMALALLRTPVKGTELCNLGLNIEDIESLDSRNLICRDDAGCYEMHDMIKEFIINRMNAKARRSLNTKIAEMYSSLPGELSSVEAIYHYAEAGDYMAGALLLVGFGEPIITYGMAPRIAAQAERIAENFNPERPLAGKYYRILGDVFDQSGDWDAAINAYTRASETGDGAQAALALTKLAGIQSRRGALDAADTAAKRAIEIAKESDSPDALCVAQYTSGNLSLEKNQLSTAIEAFKAAEKLARKLGNPKMLALAAYGSGRVEHAQGHLSQAIKSKAKAAALFEQINDKVELCRVLTSIGKSYFAAYDSKKAIEYFENAANLSEKIGNPRLLANALANTGSVLIELPNYEKAEEYLSRGLKIFDGLGEKKMIASFCQNLSLLYRLKGNPEKALPFAERGREIAVERGVQADIARAEAFLEKALIDLKRYSEAKKYIRSVLSYAEKAGNVELKKEMEKDLKALGKP